MKKLCRFATIEMFEFGRTYGNIICPFEDKIIKEIIKVIDKEDSDDT